MFVKKFKKEDEEERRRKHVEEKELKISVG